MLKNGLAALLIGLLVFGATPAPTAASQQDCAQISSDCCCVACHGQVKHNDSCVSCVREKTDQAVVNVQPATKSRVSVALYLLAESKPDIRPFFAQSIRRLNPSPPSGGPPHQALLRLWLI